ncbi:hypothetical protein GGI16_001475 [Coemansia sp. S142-1]|nr:hypothetical protein GGI16_001475 [Coemansia sp. S142-1]
MTFPSLFPTLPMLVVEKVVEYLLERRRNTFDEDIDKHNENKRILYPLLSVGEFWRDAVLVSICDNCLIRFKPKDIDIEVVFPAWPADFLYPGFHKYNLVKRVVVAVPPWTDICNSRFGETIPKALDRGVLFPSATTLLVCSIRVTPKPSGHPHLFGQTFELTDVRARVISFAHSLLKVTPAVTGVIVCGNNTSTLGSGSRRLWTSLISELCQGSANSLQAYSAKNKRVILDLMSISGLTRLIQQSNLASAPFAVLAYRNAGTLKELRIRTGTQANWRALIYGTTRTPTVYSSLTTFTMGVGNIPFHTSWAAINNVEPFPALSKLEISEEYPFGDGLFFRGNGATLKNLRIPFCVISRNALGKSGILGRNGVRQMNSVVIGVPTDSAKTFPHNRVGDAIRQQVHRLLEVTTTLKLRKDMTDFHVVSAICTAPGTAIIQNLEFTSLSFDLDRVIEIVSALPSLVSLTCQVHGTGTRLKSIPEDKLPSTLHAKHYPLSSKFRKLRLTKHASLPAIELVLVAMLIATLCPNLSHVKLRPYCRTAFCNAVNEAMAKTSFQPYVDSLQRLLNSV